MSEKNPFYAKIICGNCGNIYSRVKYTTRAGTINEFDSALMMAVMDHVTVFEDGRLKIRFYDGTEFEVETE